MSIFWQIESGVFSVCLYGEPNLISLLKHELDTEQQLKKEEGETFKRVNPELVVYCDHDTCIIPATTFKGSHCEVK